MAKNFKPGQKVVYKTVVQPSGLAVKFMRRPKENETVTIAGVCKYFGPGYYDLVEYPLPWVGKGQCFIEANLFPLEEKEQTVTLAIKKIKLEPKKVLEKTEELLTAN